MTQIINSNCGLGSLTKELSKAIIHNNAAIFCGAGISYNSGLPLANDLVRNILASIDVNETDSSIILNSNLPFEAFIQTLIDEVSVDDILEIFNTGEPNTNHELIAELVKAGFIRTVLTSNFDLLIEKALMFKGLKKGIDFEVYATEEEFGKINWEHSNIKIIKIHGCISNKEQMAITLKGVASRTIIQNKNQVVKSFFSKTVNPNVFIIGYSCSDIFDISPQIELIDSERSEVFLLEHTNKISDIIIEDISLKEIKNPFQSFTGRRIIINADYFVKQLWQTILPKPYQFQSNSISWNENISKWLNQSIEYSIGIKNHISARLFYDIGEYEISIKKWEQGIVIAQKEQNQIFFYSQLGNLGMAFNALGRYKEARRCLEESVNACQEIGNIQGEIAQLQALGNIYRNLGEFDRSIKLFKKR